MISIVVRLILEFEAVNGSTKLAYNVVEKDIVQDVSKKDIEASAKYIGKYKYVALLRMVLDKIILLIAILIIK